MFALMMLIFVGYFIRNEYYRGGDWPFIRLHSICLRTLWPIAMIGRVRQPYKRHLHGAALDEQCAIASQRSPVHSVQNDAAGVNANIICGAGKNC